MSHVRGVVDMGTARIERFLKLIGSPHETTRCEIVHVTGTNGKGSVVEMIATGLANLGRRVATFTSPFLINETDSIRIFEEKNASCCVTPIASGQYRLIREELLSVMNKSEESPTDFEFLFAVFLVFANRCERLNTLVIEVGMGGRDDATNVFKSISTICVITGVSWDHEKFLGDTLEKIYLNKCGIIHQGCRVVVGNLPKTLKTIPLCEITKLGAASFENISDDAAEFMKPPLNGPHQKYLAAIAFSVIRMLVSAEKDQIVEAMSETKLPGRLERRCDDEVNIPLILDGAHNIESAEALRNFVDEELINSGKNRVVWIIATSHDREKILPYLLRSGDTCICVGFESGQNVEWIKCADPKRLGEAASALGCRAIVVEGLVGEGIARLQTIERLNDLQVVVAGSLYLVRNYLKYVS